jgi:hypothetical protein
VENPPTKTLCYSTNTVTTNPSSPSIKRHQYTVQPPIYEKRVSDF